MSGSEEFGKPPHEMIVELAEANEWGITALAKALDVDAGHAARLRAGKTGVGRKTARRLARAFPETTEEQWLVSAARWQSEQARASIDV